MATKKTPLKISCTDTDCAADLHCFKTKAGGESAAGTCRECGVDLVPWVRVHRRDLGDVAHTFAALKHELIRHHFWHVKIDQWALNHALRKGRAVLHGEVEGWIRKKVGGANPYRDGRQTPMEKNAIFYALHATASCCRRCVEYWHGIPMGRPLTDQEVAYLSGLVRLYLDERLPNLPETGQKVSSIRSTPVSAPERAETRRPDGRASDKRRASRPSEPAPRHPTVYRETQAH